MVAAKKSPRTARSKDGLQAELDRVRSALLSKEEVDPITAAEDAKRKSNLAATLGVVTSKSVTEKLGALSLDAQATLDALRTTLISSTQELEEVREMIVIEAERLEEIYGKDVVAASLADLVAEYDKKATELATQHGAEIVAFETKLKDQRQAEADRKAAVDKERKREEEQYMYDRRKTRQEEDDAREQKVLEITRSFDEQNRELERGWHQREDVLKARENEFVEMQNTVAAFDEKLKNETAKAVAAATGAMSREHKHAVQLLEQQASADKALLRSENKALQQQFDAAQGTISALNIKLADAEKRVETIAKSAMERDSGKAALDAQQKTIETMQPSIPGKR
jgi:hypothetical protein